MTVQPVDYQKFVAMAERLLTRWGQVGTLTRPTTTGPAQNPVPGPPLTSPARFAVLDFKTDQIDGTRIRATDKQIYVSPVGLGFVPSTTDTLTDPGGGLPWKIIAVETIRPATVTCLYLIQARR